MVSFFLKKIGIFLSAYFNRKEEYFLDAQKSKSGDTEDFWKRRKTR